MITLLRRPALSRDSALGHIESDTRPMRLGLALVLTLLALAAVALLPTGCKHTVADPTLATNVQSTLAADSTIAQQPVQVSVQSGAVTLSGNVSDETASSVAAMDTAKVAGVKEVVNRLTVAGLAVTPTVTSPAAPTAPRPVTPQERAVLAQNNTLPPPPEDAPAPAPVFRDVTIAAGRDLTVRIDQGFDSGSAQPGMPFNGVLARPVEVDGMVALPAGAAVSGRVSDVKDAAHFKGSSELSLDLTSVRRHGELISLSTDPYTVEGHGRGANTAEKIGGGAALGAIVGGIFGGGRGAAIGAGAGAGGGTLLQANTRGQQVMIPSESVLHFRLTAPVTVHTAELAAGDEPQPPSEPSR